MIGVHSSRSCAPEAILRLDLDKDKEDFILCLFDNPISNTKEINEYVYGLDSTLEEMEEIEFWVQEDGGANLLARSIGLVDNHYTF